MSAGIFLFTLLAGNTTGFAQTVPSQKDRFHIKNTSFILPQPLPKGRYSHAFAIQYVVVPKDWSLDNIQAPMFNYTGKYTLPKGFNLQLSASTLIVSNRFALGPYWNRSFNNFHIGVGYQWAFNLGVLKEFGFNTVLTGWEQQPSVTVGYSFDKSVLTIRGDLYYTQALYLSEGGNTISFTNGGENGFSITTALEQRLWKNRLMSFGVKLNVVRYHILAWPTFPVNKYRYLVPEFQIGLKLGK
ncbi:hypothetical protein BH10BAC4_BH10BAC4_25480 [soil metagenome]